MKFLTSIVFLVGVAITGSFAGNTPFTRYLPDFRFCKAKTETPGVNIDKIVSNLINGVQEPVIHYCLVGCLIKRAKILDKHNWVNMTRIAELTKNVKELQTDEYTDLFDRLEKCSLSAINRRITCDLVEFSIKCAIPVKKRIE